MVAIIRESFAVPTPEDLETYHYSSDRIKPSQSKRWTDPSVIKDESVSPPPQPLVHTAPISHKARAGKSHKAGAGKARSPSTTTTTLDTRRAAAGAGHRAHSRFCMHRTNESLPSIHRWSGQLRWKDADVYHTIMTRCVPHTTSNFSSSSLPQI